MHFSTGVSGSKFSERRGGLQKRFHNSFIAFWKENKKVLFSNSSSWRGRAAATFAVVPIFLCVCVCLMERRGKPNWSPGLLDIHSFSFFFSSWVDYDCLDIFATSQKVFSPLTSHGDSTAATGSTPRRRRLLLARLLLGSICIHPSRTGRPQYSPPWPYGINRSMASIF